jgi:hypothetical protein
VGLRHPLKHLRGKAIQALRSEGMQVDVAGEDLQNKIFEVTLGLYFFPLSFDCLQLYLMAMSFWAFGTNIMTCKFTVTGIQNYECILYCWYTV